MKKSQFVVGVVMMALVVTMTSCAGSCNEKTLFSTENVSESRQLKGFEEIEINGSPTIYYTQTDSFSVKVKGPEEYVKNILTEVEGKTLVIRNKGKLGMLNIQLGDDDELAVYVTSPISLPSV